MVEISLKLKKKKKRREAGRGRGRSEAKRRALKCQTDRTHQATAEVFSPVFLHRTKVSCIGAGLVDAAKISQSLAPAYMGNEAIA